MKKIFFTVLISVFCFSSSLFAADWAKVGFSIKSKTKIKDENHIIAVDKNKKKLNIRYKSEPSQIILERISSLNNKFNSWKYVKIASISYVIENEILKVILIPKKYVYKNKKLVPHLPAGMMFIYRDNLIYNFRIANKRMFIRVKGDFISEEKLSQNIYSAIVTPLTYLKRRDPSFFLKKLAEIESKIEQLNEKNEQLTLKNSELKASYEKLKYRHDKLKYAVLTLNNEGFLGFGINKIDKKAIKRLLELRMKDSKISKKNIKNQLEQESFKISDDEIELILNVYFNEFE